MEPIDLRVASVREARNADRRFCFEIITPNFTRVYQATSEEDMKSWIYTINNALQDAVESRSASEPVQNNTPSGSIRKDIASVFTGKSASTIHRSGHGANRIVGRHATVSDRPPYRLATEPPSESSQKLLQSIRDADAGNRFCADCGSDNKVDWVSINLGIIICIECSGIHRSLGTHVSKVRSLTLDPNAFTPDVVEILLSIGNRVSNMIWEANLDRALKPTPQATREQRLRFINAKYVDRAYVQPISSTLSHYATPDETLIASIKKNDIHNVLYAIALRANVNTVDKSRGTHAVFLALAAADPALPAGQSPSRGSPGSSSTAPTSGAQTKKSFPVAELLLLNNATLPTTAAPIPLSSAAKLYLDSKAERRDGRPPSQTPSVASPGSSKTAFGGGLGNSTSSSSSVSAGNTLAPRSNSGHASDYANATINANANANSTVTLLSAHEEGGVGTGGDTLTALPVISPGGGSPSERRKRLSSGGRLVKQNGPLGFDRER
jgi:Arf-GAP/SH3 domain/ANK repeat/PH domain-containing protein